MRKNAVIKTLTPIDGGVIAPAGFSLYQTYANLNRAGIAGQTDAALLFADRRYPVARVFTDCSLVSADIAQTKTRLKIGKAQSVLLHTAPTFSTPDALKASKQTALLVAEKSGCDYDDTLILSHGKLLGSYRSAELANAVAKLGQKAKKRDILSLLNMQPQPQDAFFHQTAYAFELGAFTCKIGAAFCCTSSKISDPVGFTCILTTDVCIENTLLQKALSAAVADTVALTDFGAEASPCDAVCILASGKAQNAKIDCADLEYKKFCDVLKRALRTICRLALTVSNPSRALLTCSVSGAPSITAARSIAGAIIRSKSLQACFLLHEIDPDRVVCTVGSAYDTVRLDKAEITLKTDKGEIILLDLGRTNTFPHERAKEILRSKEIDLHICLNDGNYRAIGQTTLLSPSEIADSK